MCAYICAFNGNMRDRATVTRSFYSRFILNFVLSLCSVADAWGFHEPQQTAHVDTITRIMQGHHAAAATSTAATTTASATTTQMREQLYQMGPAKNASGIGIGIAGNVAYGSAGAEQPKPPQLPPRDSHYGTHGPQNGQDQLPTVCICYIYISDKLPYHLYQRVFFVHVSFVRRTARLR